MPTFQNSAGSGKAAKFVAANPLGPMANPFEGLDDDQKEYQKELSENVNRRMTKTMNEIKEKHARGTQDLDDPDRAPTGAAYKDHYAHQKRQAQMTQAREESKRAEESRKEAVLREEAKHVFGRNGHGDGDGGGDAPVEEDSDDSDDDAWLDQDMDSELDAIRQRRLQEMRARQEQHAEHMALGHGNVRDITQDEFLPECTGKSEWVAVHFYHSQFERCKIMDHHLKIVAPLHTDCKFLRMDAEKCPFFVSKLQIKTLPTLIVFQEGKIVDKLTGFEGLVVDPKEPDKWHTGRLRQWIASTGAIQYRMPTEEMREEMERMGIKPRGNVWSGTVKSGFRGTDYDEDDDS